MFAIIVSVIIFAIVPVFSQSPPVGPPDTSGDLIAPYPSLTDPTTANVLGTRLFGWEGCGDDGSFESTAIKDAYDDMNRIASIEKNTNITWKSSAAKDFWGPSVGRNAVTAGNRVEIQAILKNVQQLYSTWWGVRPSLWIRVRCSGGDLTGDPKNKCGDTPPKDPNQPVTCPDGSTPNPPPGDKPDNTLEAYSDPSGNSDNRFGDFSQITFCNDFFSKPPLAQAIATASRNQNRVTRLTLQEYDNQARVFFHEATHLDYFMQADSVNPFVSDLLIDYYENRVLVGEIAYGVKNAKILGRYRDLEPDQGGYYTQRNADNFAWFALANYVEDQIGSYPTYPMVTKSPVTPPTDQDGDAVLEYVTDSNDTPDFDLNDLATYEASFSLNIPQCGDKSSIGTSATVFNYSIVGYADDPTDSEPAQIAQEQAWLASIYTFGISNTQLRILPLGDSITYGYQSSDGNGYRKELYTDLSGNGNTVNLVGSVRSGTMADNSNEGHNGATIDQIASFASASLPDRPNVVLIHAGTNDMNLGLDLGNAPNRLGNLIDTVLATCPDALVLVAQIIPSGTAATQANIIAFNAAIPDVVAARTSGTAFKVMVVDMFTVLLSPDNYADGLHPNDGGYVMMGDEWYRAIGYANAVLGWVSAPVGQSGGNIPCGKLPTWYPQGEIANGAGLGADHYPSIVCEELDPGNEDNSDCTCSSPSGTGPVTIVPLTGSSCAAMGYDLIHAVHFADLNGDGRAEYLWVGADGDVTAFLNLGSTSGEESTTGATVQWLPQGVIATGIGAARQEVQFADLNGDGRAEYLWVHANGSVEAWLNLGGPNDGPNAAQVGWLYQGLIATGSGAPGSSVAFADLNGDGRAEYLSIAPDGSVTAYLNLGPTIDDGPHAGIVGWLPQGVIATGVGGLRNNTVFADINGDGRADYLEIVRSGSGAVNEWLNGGGPNNGPNAAQPVWHPQGQITTGDGTSGANVLFADLNGDGRSEYIEVNPTDSSIVVYMNGC